MTKNEAIYEKITTKLIEQMEQGVAPWSKPWTSKGGVMPSNLVSKKPYRGINAMITMFSAFESPYWLTFKQAKTLGGNIKKGSKGTSVFFYSRVVKNKGKADEDTFFMAKGYTIFNVEQTEGLEKYIPKVVDTEGLDFSPIEEAQKLILNYDVSIKHSNEGAYYSPTQDFVNMPHKESFVGEEEYYSTLFHELTHSTGHKSRLDRLEPTSFGSHKYAQEELVAEFGACFMSAMCGIAHKVTDNSVAYLQHWAKVCKANPKMLIQASSKAQKAVDLITGYEYEELKEVA